jgi:hypothetical protein
MAECFRSALTMAQAESATTVWFEVRMGSPTLGVADAFPHQAGGRHTFRPALRCNASQRS